ncbi:hypothetical protein MASR2M18_04440 [Ignavibacteria bacterium]
MLVAVIKFLTPATEIAAQVNSNPWPILGNVGIGAAANPQRMLNIHGVGITGNASDPTIRLSYNQFNADAYEPEFMGHLSLITSPYNQFTYSYCRDFFGAYQTTVKDLVLQNGLKAGDIIVATRNENGYIRFATTPPPINPDSLRPGDYQDVERLTITPSGQIGIGTHSPIGKFDVNFGSWNCEFPKISFSNNPVSGDTGHTIRPSIRFYTPTGIYQSDDNPPIPLSCEQIPARAWWLEAWNESPGSFHIRSGVNSLNATIYENPIGEEIPISRMSFLGNGNVGVNQENPKARFQVTDGSVLFDGESGATPTSGAGTRLMWIPEKAAFRAGRVDDIDDKSHEPDPSFNKTHSWDAAYIGYNSFAFGFSSRARDSHDIAIGINNDANSESTHGAIAIGHANSAIGADVFAFGYSNRAKGECSQIYGRGCKTNGLNALSIGAYNRSDTANTYTFGYGCVASASKSICIGVNDALDSDNNQDKLINDKENSILLGVKSTNGVFITTEKVNKPNSNHIKSFTRVGIGSTEPKNTLGVNGNVVIGWGGSKQLDYQYDSLSTISLATEKKVGIGTYNPTELLSVIGGSTIIWNDPNASVGNDVDLAVRQKVLIGRNTVIAPNEDNYPNQATILHVAGRVMKNDGDGEWDNPSDAKLKKDIQPYYDGLTQIRNIRPVWYSYKNELGLSDERRNIGVIAQEIRPLLPYTVREDSITLTKILKQEKRYEVDAIDIIVVQVPDYTQPEVSGHYKRKDSTILKPVKRQIVEPTESVIESTPILVFNGSSIKYLLINAVKELDTALQNSNERTASYISSLHEQINSYQKQNDSLKCRFEELEVRLRTIENQTTGYQDLGIFLEQNRPNPFSETTIISYYIPANISGTIELIIASADAETIFQHFEVSKGMPGQIEVDARNLEKGVYLYGIAVNGAIRASKKMIILK